MTTTRPAIQTSALDLPFVKIPDDKRESNTSDNGCDLSYPSDPTWVAYTFQGTQAEAFGFIEFNDTPLEVSITGSSGTFPNFTQDTPDRTQPSQFNITSSLPCDEYNLTFILRPDQSVHIDQFSSVPCSTSTDKSQLPSTVGTPSSSSVGTPTNAPIASTSRNSLSTGLIVGLVFSSLLLLLILCGIVLLFVRWRRRQQRSGSGPGSWSRLHGYRAQPSPPAPVLSVGSGGGLGEVPPRSRFGLYMFEFKPPASTAVTQELSPSLLATSTEPQAPPRPMPAEPPQGWLDANRDKPPRYSRGGWAADPDLEMGEPVIRGYLPDSKEWIPPPSQGDEQGDHSSEWGTVPTNHAVESVVI